MIAIIAILAGMLLPALSRAKETSHTASCKANLKTIALASSNYNGDFDGYFFQKGWWAAPEINPVTNVYNTYPLKNGMRENGRYSTGGARYGCQVLPALAWLYMGKDAAALYCPGDQRNVIAPQWDKSSSYCHFISWSPNYRHPFTGAGASEAVIASSPYEKVQFIRYPSGVMLTMDTLTGGPTPNGTKTNGFYYQNGFPVDMMVSSGVITGNGYTIQFKRNHRDHYNFNYVDGHADSRPMTSLLGVKGKNFVYYKRNSD